MADRAAELANTVPRLHPILHLRPRRFFWKSNDVTLFGVFVINMSTVQYRLDFLRGGAVP